MPKNWRWKALLTLFLILLSIYFLVPTIGKFEVLSEGGNPPWYVKLFPKEEIKLGLDLRGGIYSELEVGLEEALENRADLIAGEIERLSSQEGILLQKVERVSDSTAIRLTSSTPEAREAAVSWIRKNYREVLYEKRGSSEPTVALFDLSESYAQQNKDLAVRQAVETIRNRIDRYGVTEPSISRLGENRISIELPGITNPERALDLIKKAGRLEFKLLDEKFEDPEIRKWVLEAREALKLADDNFTEEAVQQINKQLKGKIPESDQILFEVQYDPISKKIVGGVPYLIKRKAEVTGEMLKNAQVNVQNNEPYVSLTFNPTGARLFKQVTGANIKKRLAIILDDTVSAAPVIQGEIPNGEAQITLGYGDYNSLLRQAEDLTLVLREGALPARLKELTKTIVGPSLGQDSIDRGVRVVLFAGLLVFIFMAVYYRFSGVLADLALFLNILFIMGALAIFQATLTLPGIAGIVLTIGMAVDANVLIFERMREELRSGKSAHESLKLGYENATSAIMDSNITTLLAGIVLYQFGTGPIRGFAVTLMIGVFSTLLTALIVTRLLQDWALHGLRRQTISV